jgi:uncharacterized repeat protein (TIGR03803 family)
MKRQKENSYPMACQSRPALLAVAVFCIVFAGVSLHAQTFTVLHSFIGQSDGANPLTGLTVDRGGNFYGTTTWGGTYCQGYCSGTVFRLKSGGSGWILTQLYTFDDNATGYSPNEPVTIGPDGTLYGSAKGGEMCDPDVCGVIFRLQPPFTICRSTYCPWMETLLHTFSNEGGAGPSSQLIFDNAGNMYGTTAYNFGGINSNDVFQMSRSNGQWVYTNLYTFTGGSDGKYPYGLTFDSAGNLYGAAAGGGLSGCQNYGCGTLWELVRTGNGWTFHLLYSFTGGNDGGYPDAGLVADASGNFYGTTLFGGTNGNGTVFELSPSNGSWTLTTLYSFTEQYADPMSPLVLDSSGNLYGTTTNGGSFGQGSVFKLTTTNSGWVYSSLHDFTGGSDGQEPSGSPVLDAQGNLYGTTFAGGLSCDGFTCGVIWKITQ